MLIIFSSCYLILSKSTHLHSERYSNHCESVSMWFNCIDRDIWPDWVNNQLRSMRLWWEHSDSLVANFYQLCGEVASFHDTPCESRWHTLMILAFGNLRQEIAHGFEGSWGYSMGFSIILSHIHRHTLFQNNSNNDIRKVRSWSIVTGLGREKYDSDNRRYKIHAFEVEENRRKRSY